MQKELTPSVHPSAIVGTTMIVAALSLAALLLLAGSTSFEVWGVLVLLPVLVALTLPALALQANREATPALFWLLALALVMKLVGALARHYVAFDVYEGGADAASYHEFGVELAQKFRAWDFQTGLEHLTGTNFVQLLTGIVYTVIGASSLSGFVFFSWLGFIGLFLFYRAFTEAVPTGRSRTYARLVFFLPSLLFWPSSIGKEAWMMFALGIAAFGTARLLTGRAFQGVPVIALGLFLAAVIRPHIAALYLFGVVAALVVRRRSEKRGAAARLGRIAVLAGLVAASLVMAARAEQFLQEAGLETDQGVASTLTQATERSAKGGSEFAPSLLRSPAQAPNAVITVLYRPFVTEVDSAQAVMAALEGTFLLFLTVLRLPWILAAIRSMRRQPYVAYALANTVFMVLALSSFANFGILARQRVQLLPMLLVLLAIPPVRKRLEAARRA